MLPAAIQAEVLRLRYAERWGYSQIDRHLGIHRESVRKVAARIKAAKFVQLQTADTFNFEYSPATRKLRHRCLNLLATDLVAEGIGALFVGGSGLTCRIR